MAVIRFLRLALVQLLVGLISAVLFVLTDWLPFFWIGLIFISAAVMTWRGMLPSAGTTKAEHEAYRRWWSF